MQDTDEILALITATRKASEMPNAASMSCIPGLEDVLNSCRISTANAQAILREVQWKLLSHAERCYWAASSKLKASHPKVCLQNLLILGI